MGLRCMLRMEAVAASVVITATATPASVASELSIEEEDVGFDALCFCCSVE